MADWIGWLIFAAWITVGSFALCQAMRYEDDLDLIDLSFYGICGAVFGPMSLIVWLCEWHQNRAEPIIIAKRKRK